MREPSTTRRALLGRGGAAVGAAALGSTAGCLAGFRPPAFQRWLPTPEALGAPCHYPFEAYDLAALAVREDAFPSTVDFSNLAVGWEPAPFDWRDVSRFVRLANVVLVDAPVDRRATREAFADRGMTVRGERAGHTLLTAPEAGSGVAIGDESFVGAGLAFARVREPLPVLETFVDAVAGRAPRYVAEREALDATLDALGDGHYLRATTRHGGDEGTPEQGSFAGEVARGHAWTVDGATTSGRWVRTFETAADVPVEAVRAWVAAEREEGRFAPYQDFSVRARGGVAVVDAVAATDDRW